jgi:Fe-S cluster biosynthesis and repair protein YggX
MFLEDGEWEKADDFCEQVLNHDPENAMAYLGKLMAELKVKKQEALKNRAEPFSDNSNYQKAIRFGNGQLKLQLQGDVAHIKMRNENARKDAIYKDAMEKMDRASITSCKEAISLFQSISGWKDADNQAAICEQKILKFQELKKNSIYTSAVNKMCSKKSSDIQEAIELFRSISGWKDADEKVVLCQKQKKELDAQDLIAKAKQKEQEQISRKLWEEEQQKRLLSIREKLLPAQKLLSAGMRHTVGLMVGGKAVAVGCNWDDRCDVYCLKDIVAVATGAEFTILLTADGTVQIRGNNRNNNYHTYNWSDIVAVAGGEKHAVGLKADGTVVATGDDTRGQCDVSGWTDIIAISAGTFHTVGLKSNGTVVSTHKNTNNWQDIVAVAAGGGNTIGLKSNGTIVTTDPILDKSWSEIVAISAGFGHVVGLKSDGTVVATGMNKDLQCKVNGWANIVAVSAGRLHTVGLKSDGTLVATGWNEHRQCDVSAWKLFNNYDNLKTENKEATTQKWKIRGRCQHCGGELKGFFSKKCISCGKSKDY